MEGGDETTTVAAAAVVKGKRTKRQRSIPKQPASVVVSSLSISTSSSSSAESSNSTTILTEEEEEEDMANCLILLAQGRTSPTAAAGDRTAAVTTTTTSSITRGYVYECKTCNKCFPSFQALGGHRASHKKPKITSENSPAQPTITVATIVASDHEIEGLLMRSAEKTPVTTPVVVVVPAKKQKVHECSICGSEFSSGQALGGHMRRHRPLVPAEEKKEKNFLELDLNLPAPSDDDVSDPEQFLVPPIAPLLLPSPALVGCHY